LSEYIGSTVNSFMTSQKEEEEKQRLVRKFLEYISKMVECTNCTSTRIAKFIIFEGELVCTDCGTHYDMLCPRCKTRPNVTTVDVNTTDYRCPSCKFSFQSP
jgi:DNA-directed RNA polymerase subunit RPC12/RpoP